MATIGSSFLDYLQNPNPLHVGQAKLFRGREFAYERDVYNMAHRFALRCQKAERVWEVWVPWRDVEMAGEYKDRILIDALTQLFTGHDRDCPSCRPVEVQYTRGAYAYRDEDLDWEVEKNLKRFTTPKGIRVIRFRRKLCQ